MIDEQVLAESLGRLCADGLYCSGLQAYVSTADGSSCSLAAGSAAPGRAMTEEGLIALWCASKPVVAVAAALALEQRDIGLDAPLTSLPHWPWRGSDKTSTQDLLTHRVGLAQPRALDALFLSNDLQRDAALRAFRLESVAGGQAYSEFSSGVLLRLVIEACSGREASDFIRVDLLHPLGLTDDLLFDRVASDPQTVSRVMPVVFGLPYRPCYSYHDRIARFANSDRVALGAYGNALALGGFYRFVLFQLGQRGSAPDCAPVSCGLLSLMAGCRSGPYYDRVLRDRAEFAAGFQVVGPHWHPNLSPAAIGHAGFFSSTFALCDPELGLACAVVTNGLNEHAEDRRQLRREALSAILRAVEDP